MAKVTLTGRPLAYKEAVEIAAYLRDRDVEATVALSRFGPVAEVPTPWHELPVLIRCWDDAFSLLAELVHRGEWHGDEPADAQGD